MAKSFLCRRTEEGGTVMEDAMEHVRQCLDNNEKKFGRLSPETWKARLILAVMYSAAEDYKKVKPLLAPYVAATKGKPETNPKLMFWAYTLLAETYFMLNLIPEAMEISLEGKAMAKEIDWSTPDQLLESLVTKVQGASDRGNP